MTATKHPEEGRTMCQNPDEPKREPCPRCGENTVVAVLAGRRLRLDARELEPDVVGLVVAINSAGEVRPSRMPGPRGQGEALYRPHQMVCPC